MLSATWRALVARFLPLAAAIALSCLTLAARAQSPFAVDAFEEGRPLGKHLAVLEDAAHALTISDIAGGRRDAQFVASQHDAPGYGITRSAYWVRLPVENGASEARAWLFELGYPHLDSIELYIPRADGSYERRAAGDKLAFARRELDHRNFLFRLSEPPRGVRTYYLRIATSGGVNLPVRAWTYEGFVAHEGRETPVVWMFYGIVAVMAAYNLFIFFAVRQREYLYYVLYEASLLVCQFTVLGHSFQHLIPEHPELANRAVLLFVPITFFWALMFMRTFLRLRETLPRLDRILFIQSAACIGLVALYPFLPYAFALRLIVIFAVTIIPVGSLSVFLLLRRGQRTARYYAISWSVQFMGTLAYMLRLGGILPSTFFTEWGIEIGATLEVLLLSIALADRINTLSANMSELNGQLSNNVAELKAALSRAEEATRAKSEFLATMSHELRTPLNAIINVPQGLANEFVAKQVVACGQCHSLFEQEEGDAPVTAETRCPECDASESLREEKVSRYIGTPELTLRHLKLIERSGKHLLQMVNGVLDFSKIGAGRLKLQVEEVPVIETVEDAVETLSQLAASAGVKLAFCADIEPGAVVRADPLRLKQILINLIGNAIKFSNGRGSVNVTVCREENAYCFRVSDQGIGIAPENQRRIFESFEQVDRGDTRRYGGTGLGLSISRSLVEMHGGRIWVESELDVGSTFAFLVPEAGPPASGRASEVDMAFLRTRAANDTAPPKELAS